MKILQSKMIQTILIALGLLLLNACGSSGSKASDTNTTVPDTNTTTPDTTSITHNGTTYGFVTSPYTGKVWLDKNLGAAEVCAGFDDAACYGNYYQWGRGYDGHQESNSGTTATQATDVTTVGHGDFITSDNTNDDDWAKAVDSDGSLRQANWSKTDGTSVCPIGFRVPTKEELGNETIMASDVIGSTKVINSATAATNFLNLPSAGSRRSLDGNMEDVGSWGSVLSVSVSGSFSHYLLFSSSDAELDLTYRASGISVRCLKD